MSLLATIPSSRMTQIGDMTQQRSCNLACDVTCCLELERMKIALSLLRLASYLAFRMAPVGSKRRQLIGASNCYFEPLGRLHVEVGGASGRQRALLLLLSVVLLRGALNVHVCRCTQQPTRRASEQLSLWNIIFRACPITTETSRQTRFALSPATISEYVAYIFIYILALSNSSFSVRRYAPSRSRTDGAFRTSS